MDHSLEANIIVIVEDAYCSFKGLFIYHVLKEFVT